MDFPKTLKMNRPIEIERLMKGTDNSSQAFINISASLMSNFNMSFEEVKNLPIPTAIEYMKILKENKKKGFR